MRTILKLGLAVAVTATAPLQAQSSAQPQPVPAPQQPDKSSAYGGMSGSWTTGLGYSRQRACTSPAAGDVNDPTCLGQNSGIYSSGESPCRPAGGWAEKRFGKADASRTAPCTANDAQSNHAHGTPQGPALDTRPADTRLPDPQPLQTLEPKFVPTPQSPPTGPGKADPAKPPCTPVAPPIGSAGGSAPPYKVHTAPTGGASLPAPRPDPCPPGQ